jgi:hypothetical protein
METRQDRSQTPQDQIYYRTALRDPDSITKSLEATIPRVVLSSGAQYTV